MKKYTCKVCGFVYDPVKGYPDDDIAPNTPFEDLSENWLCPVCGAPKENFYSGDIDE